MGERTTTPNHFAESLRLTRSLYGRKDDNSQQVNHVFEHGEKSIWEKGRQLPTPIQRLVQDFVTLR